MSKTSSSRLTASRKKARRRRPVRTVKTVEALNGLAGLLEACGEPMEAGQVASAGTLIAEQVRRLEELMTALDKETR